MREIKFRAWSKEEGMSAPFGLERLNNNSTGYYADLDDGTFELDDAEFMQFTGLKDKNGKEIYEGDILRISSKPPYEDEPFLRKVSLELRAPACGFVLGDAYHDYVEHFGRIMKDDDTDWDVEVIGNIYESPELLKTN